MTKKLAGVFTTLSVVASMPLGGGRSPSQSSEHSTLAGKLRKVDFKNTHTLMTVFNGNAFFEGTLRGRFRRFPFPSSFHFALFFFSHCRLGRLEQYTTSIYKVFFKNHTAALKYSRLSYLNNTWL